MVLYSTKSEKVVCQNNAGVNLLTSGQARETTEVFRSALSLLNVDTPAIECSIPAPKERGYQQAQRES
jgi:hypothetical protein